MPAASDRVDTITGIRSRPTSPSRAYRQTVTKSDGAPVRLEMTETVELPHYVGVDLGRAEAPPRAPLSEPLAATMRGLGISGPLEPLDMHGPDDDGKQHPGCAECATISGVAFGSPTRKVRCQCGALIVTLERDELPERCGFCARPLTMPVPSGFPVHVKRDGTGVYE